MGVTLGPNHRVVPNQNLGQNIVAQRRLAEVAGRAAQKTRVSVSVDAWQARLYLKNPRGTIPCACCAYSGDGGSDSFSPGGHPRVILDGGEFDDIGALESGYPRGNERNRVSGQELRAQIPDITDDEDVGLTVQRMLIGNGRRCGVCWGTGFIDGHRLWGGNRRVMCVVDAPGVSFVSGTVDVESDSTCPTMVGPGVVVWSVQINQYDVHLDVIRVRDQLAAAPGGYTLQASSNGGSSYGDPLTTMQAGLDGAPTRGSDGAAIITPGTYLFQLTLQDGARVSHVELVSRSENLVNLQLPQLAQQASAELVAPFLTEEFELDPVVGFVERGSVMDVEPRDGRTGSVWVVTDVTVKHTSAGQIFGVVGTARAAQPTDVIACASASDALATGLQDRGYATRGLESTGMGVPAGLEDATDESVAAARRGSQQRLGGGQRDAGRSTVVLNTGEY